MRRYLFIIDQAFSSLITMCLFLGIARLASLEWVGVMTTAQAIALIFMSMGRATGVDVWIANGARPEHMKAALGNSFYLCLLGGLVSGAVVFTVWGFTLDAIFYVLGLCAFVSFDCFRIAYIHVGGSGLSATLNGILLSGVALGVFIFRDTLFTFIFYGLLGSVSLVVSILRLRPLGPLRSFSYFRNHSKQALSFVVEIALGSASQQLSLILVGSIASLATLGSIRVAQTVVGPLGVAHGAAAPLLARRFVRVLNRRRPVLFRLSVRAAVLFAALTLSIVLLLCFLLSFKMGDRTVLSILLNRQENDLIEVVFAAGISLSCSGLLLAFGVGARFARITGEANRIRIILVPFQLGLVTLTALLDNSALVLSAFAAVTFLSSSYIWLRLGKWAHGGDWRPVF
ncbi:hypothetical protein [Sinomonas atrocyanea]|uniref:hypothetical protein n=1 Tax=Sinomonas atrocyanea TaxID=37927 RepID=UPI003D98333B